MKRKCYFSFMMLFLLSFMSFAQQQDIVVKGIVLAEGLPLVGASVIVKGTTNGTQTDFDGSFTITAKNGELLVISYLGYTTQQVFATAAPINVTLEVDVNELDQVVVTSLGIRKEKQALGYAVTSIDGEELENKAETDIGRSLQGKIAGVQINVSSGSTGNEAIVRVRSSLSVTNSNSPLIVVDNVPFNGGLIDIDPNDIETLSVLKGLNASLLYGSEGRNGVILITTKSGSSSKSKEKISINVSQTTYINEVASLPKYQNKFGQGSDNRFSGGTVGNWGAPFTDRDEVPHPYSNNPAFPEFADAVVPYVPQPGNVKAFFNSGIGTVTAFNFRSSQEKTSFRLSTSYTDEKGIIGNNDLKRFNISVGGSAQLSEKLDVSGSLRYSTRKRNSQIGSDIFDLLLYIPRSLNLIDLPYQDPVTGANVYYRASQNPNWVINNTGRNDDVTRFFLKFRTRYDFNDNLRLTYRIGLDNDNEVETDFTNRGGVDDPTGFLVFDNTNDQVIDQTLILNADYKLSKRFSFDGQLGANLKTRNLRSDDIEYTNQVVFDFLRPDNFDTANGDQFIARENIAGIFGQLEFSYRKHLYLTLSGRYDKSSVLESENQSLFYPGTSVSFIPTKAFKGLKSKTLRYLKIRGAYATSAGFPGLFRTRNNITNILGFSTDLGQTRINGVETRLGNPNLRAELHKEFEFGLESRWFKSRVDFEASIFKRISEDQIVDRLLDPSVGYLTTATNIGRVDTKGIELDLNVDILKSKKLNWSIRNIFTAYRTEVIELEAPISLGNDRFAIEGQPLGVLQEDYALRDPQGNLLINPINGELLVSDDVGLPDRVIGDPTPDWALTTISTLKYKNLSLFAQLEYTRGGDNISDAAYDLLRRGVTRDTENRGGSYIIPGVYGDPTTGVALLDANGQTIPNTIQSSDNATAFSNYYEANDLRMFDTTLFRIREIALSYNLDGKKNNLPFNKMSVTLSGRNIFHRAPNYPRYTNIDPEVDRGSTTVPTTKRFALGISLSF